MICGNAKITANDIQVLENTDDGITADGTLNLNDCSFYDCPYEERAIELSDNASLNCSGCSFGILPEDEEDGEHEHVPDVKQGVHAKGNAKALMRNTQENCKSTYFIKAEKTASISTDAGEVQFVAKID